MATKKKSAAKTTKPKAKSSKTTAKKKPAKKKVTKKGPAKKKVTKKGPAKKKVTKKAKPPKDKPKKAPPKPKKATPKKKVKSKKKTALAIEAESGYEAGFSLESKVHRQKEVAWRMIEGEAVIITPADSTMHTLNDVGTRIWELITGDRTLHEVASILCAEFEVEQKRAEKDTLWFAECLAKKGLVKTG